MKRNNLTTNQTNGIGLSTNFYIDKVECIRCSGKGKANPFTYPEQSTCCHLCNGTGKNEVEIYPSCNLLKNKN